MKITFGSLVRQYITGHDLSYQDIADKLGYRSKTSVARILQDATGYELRQDFYARFRAAYPLSSSEQNEMETLLRISQMSVDQQQFYLCFRRMFLRRYALEPVRCLSASDNSAQDLSVLLRQRCRQSDHVTVMAFGWCSPSALRHIHQTLSALKLTFEIRHTVYEGGSTVRLAELTAQIAAFVFDPRYLMQRVPHQEGAAELEGMFLLNIRHADGSADDIILMQLKPDLLLCQTQTGGTLYRTLRVMLEGLGATPLKTGSEAEDPPYQQALQLIDHQLQLWGMEKNQAIYSYSKDLDLSLVPPEIFKNAAQWSGLTDSVPEQLYRDFCDVQQKRYQNLHAQKTPSQFILSRESVKNFIWSGRLHNHPFMLRAFTPRERFDILNDVLSRLDSQPFFSIRLADESMPQLWNALNILCVRPMNRASAHSKPAHGSLALLPASQPGGAGTLLSLESPDLADAFIAYYQDELLSLHTLPQRASRDLLQTMLQYHAARFG